MGTDKSMTDNGNNYLTSRKLYHLKEDIKPRLYQELISATATNHNTLVVLPTGLGKTLIAEMVALNRLNNYPGSKILFLAPTKPLVEQHKSTFLKDTSLREEELTVFTGAVKPAKRAELFSDPVVRVIFSTPQGLENDIISKRLSLKEVSLIIFDEAHRATGDYSYVLIAKEYLKRGVNNRILGLTASPGSDKESIRTICSNLGIERLEVRSNDSPDVAPYVQELDLQFVKVKLNDELRALHRSLKRLFDTKIEELLLLGFNKRQVANKVLLLKAQGYLQAKMSRGGRSFEDMKASSVIAEALKIQHALELVETQGVSSLKKYLEKLVGQSITGKVKAVKNLVGNPLFKEALLRCDRLLEEGVEHPKLREVKRQVLRITYNYPSAKIIIFNQYRDQAVKIKEALDSINVDSRIFVGQVKKGETGMSQKEQKAIINSFRNDEFPVLIATSVAEEGLDIPSVDFVIFYEPVPSAIRTVQRRGRTGRMQKGKVLVLVTEGTRDEGYRWAAHHKEKKMYRAIAEVKKEFEHNNTVKISTVNNSAINSSNSASSDNGKEGLQKVISEYKSGEGGVSKEHDNTVGACVDDVDDVGSGKNDLEDGVEIRSKEEGVGEGAGGKALIIADHREKSSGVLKELFSFDDVDLRLEQLGVGDYLLSDRVVVELKRVPDFVDSIVDGRLFSQLSSMRRFRRPILIIEGDEDLFGVRKVHPNAIRGMIAAIMVNYNIPVFFSKSSLETAALMRVIAIKEQGLGRKPVFEHHTQKPGVLFEQQEYFLASIPGLGSSFAKRLLEHFGSLRAVLEAGEDDLLMVDGFGKKRARALKEFLDAPYDPSK